jgi:hypothetical protein
MPGKRPAPWPPGAAAPEPAGRAKLWKLDSIYFCSVIGTCLGTGELRKLVARATGERMEGSSDLQVHERAVRIAGHAEQGGRLLHKALEQRHQPTVRRYEQAKTADDLLQLWQESLSSGDVPGAYWAILTHRATTRDVRARAFGDVHMLSHLVGAANRADIRRLAALDAENAALTAKVERQERRLRESIQERDETIGQLRAALSASLSRQSACGENAMQADRRGEEALHGLVASLQQRLAHAGARQERAETRARAAESALAESRVALERATRTRAELEAELLALEARLADDGASADARSAPSSDASPASLVVLYVGGRPGPLCAIRDIVRQHGGTFVHHDGGMEERMGLIVGDIRRADLVFFPIDCVSHEAVKLVKRSCAQAGKRFHALRTSGVGSFAAALARIRAAQAQAADPAAALSLER